MDRLVQTIASTYKKSFKLNRTYPSITDRTYWDQVDKSISLSIREDASKFLEVEYPRLTASMYLRYSEDGDRSEYWDAYILRRHILNTFVLAECIEFKGRYNNAILDALVAICEESSWVIPAHNTYIRDENAIELPDVERPVLELMSCETGANLSLIIYLLKDVLNDISTLIISRVKFELERRVINPYLNEHFWWMGHGDEPMNNWTIWCTQNVLHLVSLVEWPSDIVRKVFNKGTRSMDYFLKEYELDGCCDEGVIYYRKAGLCLNTTINILNQMTDGHFKSLWEQEKIINIGDYIRKVYSGGDYFINFADCSAIAGACGGREYDFALKTDNKKLEDFAVWSRLNMKPSPEWNMNLYDRLIDIFHYQEMSEKKPSHKLEFDDSLFPSTGISVLRDNKICAGIKAGDNADSHNHNDVGSFILYREEHPFIIDIGVETYSRKTFSDQRYDIWTMQSDYHNLPTINGMMQKPGSDYKANILTEDYNENQTLISMELIYAYPDNVGVNSFIREYDFKKNEYFKVVDTVRDKNSETSIISNFIFYEEPVIEDNNIKFSNGWTIKFDGPISRIEKELLPITDDRLKWSWNHDIYRLRVYWSGATLNTYINLI